MSMFNQCINRCRWLFLSQVLALVLALILVMTLACNVQAAGLMQPTNSQLPQLSIRDHDVHVVVENGYVTTSVEQIFYNPSDQQLEARYSFPLPEQAAVGEFVYWIDGKPVIGEVVAKQQARDIYQQQKQAGKRVALTEQDSYRTFDSLVYPVEPHSEVRIKLVYIQAAHLDSNTGRYVYPLEDGGVDDASNAFWTRTEAVQDRFSFNMEIRSSYPLDGVRLPKQPNAVVRQISPQLWRIQLGPLASQEPSAGREPSAQEMPLANKEPSANIQPPTQTQPVAMLDQDILVYWRLQPDLPGSVDLVSYRAPGKSQGTFMVTLTPGDDLPAIQGQRDWNFVLDVSGSMAGKYATLLEGVRKALIQLPQGDRFRIVTFNNRARDLTGGYQVVTGNNVRRVIDQLQQDGTGGGTNLYAGLSKGLSRLDDDRVSAVVLVTDGVANVGTTEKKAFLKLIKDNDVRLFTFIMGNSANRPLLQQMTDLSNGFSASISNADDVIGQLMLATSKINHAALRDVSLQIDGVRVTDLTPASPGTLYRGQQLVLFGHYFEPGQAELTLRGKVNGQERVYRTQVELAEVAQDNPELERLWAFSRIEALQNQIDYLGSEAASTADSEQAITDLAVEYGLVTDYTSLLVVEEQVFDQLGIDRSNQQRVDTENQARQQRAQQLNQQQQQPTNTRADRSQPMFNQPRAGTGSGAIDGSILLLLLALGLPALLVRIKGANPGANKAANQYSAKRTSAALT